METDKIKSKLSDIRFDLFIITTVISILLGLTIANRRITISIGQQVQLLEQRTIDMQSSLDSISGILSDTCSNNSFSGR